MPPLGWNDPSAAVPKCRRAPATSEGDDPVRLLEWIFGRKERPVETASPVEAAAPVREAARTAAAGPVEHLAPPPEPKVQPAVRGPEKREALPPEAENLRRWRESGQARAW